MDFRRKFSPWEPAAASLGRVCHTALRKRLDLCGSWCSKCAVIAWSHVAFGHVCVRACVRPTLQRPHVITTFVFAASHPASFHTLIKVLLVNPRADLSRPSRWLIGGKCNWFFQFFCAAAI